MVKLKGRRHGDRLVKRRDQHRAQRVAENAANADKLRQRRKTLVDLRDAALADDRYVLEEQISEIDDRIARGDFAPTYADRVQDRLRGYHAKQLGAEHVSLDEVKAPPVPPRTDSPRPRTASRRRSRERRSPRSTRAGPDGDDPDQPDGDGEQGQLVAAYTAGRLAAIADRLRGSAGVR